MSLDDPLHRLEDLARAAELHARQEHGLALNNVDQVDQILRAEAGRPDPQRAESLAATYGAWVGELARRRWRGGWVGLSEPAAPRLSVASILVSPIDAVRRRLQDPAAPTLAVLFQQLES